MDLVHTISSLRDQTHKVKSCTFSLSNKYIVAGFVLSTPFVQSLYDPRLYFRESSNQLLVQINHRVPLTAEALTFLKDAF